MSSDAWLHTHMQVRWSVDALGGSTAPNVFEVHQDFDDQASLSPVWSWTFIPQPDAFWAVKSWVSRLLRSRMTIVVLRQLPIALSNAESA
jgi:hypothetical protein